MTKICAKPPDYCERETDMRKPIIKRTRRTSEQAAMDERLKKEREAEDLDAFLPSYERATGLRLNVEAEAEDPDFVCSRSDGMTVGVELTAVWHGPEFSLFRSMPEISTWDVEDDCDHMWGLVEKKSEKLKGYRTKYNALVLQIVEGDFRALADYTAEIPIKDFEASGFDEIWLADFTGLRSGMHLEVPIVGLFPASARKFTDRSDRDKKPYR